MTEGMKVESTSQAGQDKPKHLMTMPIARAIDKISEARDTFRSGDVPKEWSESLTKLLREFDEYFPLED